MPNFLSEFFLGFLCSTGLFVLCALLVLGAKSFLSYFKNVFYTKTQPTKTKQAKKTKTVKAVKPKRIIEINPDEVDQIFVKKVS